MKGEFNINISVRPKYVETFKADTPRPLSKKDSISLKNRIEHMRQIREQEMSSLDINPGGLNITVTPQIKGWVDKKDHRKERGDRTSLESRAVFKWKSGADIQKAQERIALDRK